MSYGSSSSAAFAKTSSGTKDDDYRETDEEDALLVKKRLCVVEIVVDVFEEVDEGSRRVWHRRRGDVNRLEQRRETDGATRAKTSWRSRDPKRINCRDEDDQVAHGVRAVTRVGLPPGSNDVEEEHGRANHRPLATKPRAGV